MRTAPCIAPLRRPCVRRPCRTGRQPTPRGRGSPCHVTRKNIIRKIHTPFSIVSKRQKCGERARRSITDQPLISLALVLPAASRCISLSAGGFFSLALDIMLTMLERARGAEGKGEGEGEGEGKGETGRTLNLH